MAAQDKTQSQVLADLDHVPGSADSDMSEPQIPRVSSPEAGPGDKAAAVAHPKVGAEAPEEAAMKQAAQQQQAQAQPGARTGAERTSEPLVGADPDDDDEDEIGSDDDDDLDDDEGMDEVEDDDEGMTLDSAATAPLEAGDMAIEDEPFDTSILGDGHADKAAWNRERLASLPTDDDAGRGRTPGSSEDMGYGGGAPNEDVDPDLPGLDTGDGMLDDLADETEEEEDDHLSDAASGLDDEDPKAHMADAILGDDGEFSDFGADPDRGAGGRVASDALTIDPDGQPELFGNGDLDDGDMSPEDLIIAVDGEDPLLAGVELGFLEELDMEGLNETDDISRDLEDQRADMDDSASGNERQNQPG